MRENRLFVDDQIEAFYEAVRRNEVIPELLERTAAMDLPGWYVTAGCLFQSVWNAVTGRPAGEGIKDYDVFYFDDADLTWEAEDRVIKAADQAFADLPVTVEVRNEARVHLWYEERFGAPCPAFASSEAAIDCFAATTCSVGIRVERDGRWRLYAPYGLSDVFNLVLRPNPAQAPRHVYETKAARWQAQWPSLTVLPWPA